MKGDADGENGDNKYTYGVKIIFIDQPQGDAERLKHIKWVEDLQEADERQKEI